MLSSSYKGLVLSGKKYPIDDDDNQVQNQFINDILCYRNIIFEGRLEELVPLENFIPLKYINYGYNKFSELIPEQVFYDNLREIFCKSNDMNIILNIGNMISFITFSLSEADLLKYFIHVENNIFNIASNYLTKFINIKLFKIISNILIHCLKYQNTRLCFPKKFNLLFYKYILSLDNINDLNEYYLTGLKYIFFFSKNCSKEDSHFILTTFSKIFHKITQTRKCYKYFCCTCIEMIEKQTLIKVEFDSFQFIETCIDLLSNEDEKIQIYSLLIIGKYLSKYNENLNLDIRFFINKAIISNNISLQIDSLWVSSMLLNEKTIEILLNSDALPELISLYHKSELPLKDEIILFVSDLILAFLSQPPCSMEGLLFSHIENLKIIPLILENILYNTSKSDQERIYSTIIQLCQRYGETMKQLMANDETHEIMTELLRNETGIIHELVTFIKKVPS